MAEIKSSPQKFCINNRDAITLDDLDHIGTDVVLIFESKNSKQAECYQRSALQKLFPSAEDAITIWKYIEIRNADGSTRQVANSTPDGERLLRLPFSGKWISNYLILDDGFKIYYLGKPKLLPIGSSAGMSRLHGAEENVYKLYPGDLADYDLQDFYNAENMQAEIKMKEEKESETEKREKKLQQYYSNYSENVMRILNSDQTHQLEKLLQTGDIEAVMKVLRGMKKKERRLMVTILITKLVEENRLENISTLAEFPFEWFSPLFKSAEKGNVKALKLLCQLADEQNANILDSEAYSLVSGFAPDDSKFHSMLVNILLVSQENIKPYLKALLKCGANVNLILNTVVITLDRNIESTDTQLLRDYLALIRWCIVDKKAIPNPNVVNKNRKVIGYILTNISKDDDELLEYINQHLNDGPEQDDDEYVYEQEDARMPTTRREEYEEMLARTERDDSGNDFDNSNYRYSQEFRDMVSDRRSSNYQEILEHGILEVINRAIEDDDKEMLKFLQKPRMLYRYTDSGLNGKYSPLYILFHTESVQTFKQFVDAGATLDHEQNFIWDVLDTLTERQIDMLIYYMTNVIMIGEQQRGIKLATNELQTIIEKCPDIRILQAILDSPHHNRRGKEILLFAIKYKCQSYIDYLVNEIHINIDRELLQYAIEQNIAIKLLIEQYELPVTVEDIELALDYIRHDPSVFDYLVSKVNGFSLQEKHLIKAIENTNINLVNHIVTIYNLDITDNVIEAVIATNFLRADWGNRIKNRLRERGLI